MSQARPRQRKVEVTAAPVPEDIRGLAKKFFIANRKKNDSDREAKEARKELLKKMKDAKLTSFNFAFQEDGNNFACNVEISTPTKTVIDIDVLRKLVPEETFMQIVTASQSAVESIAGKVIATRAGKTVEGEEKVDVKAAK